MQKQTERFSNMGDFVCCRLTNEIMREIKFRAWDTQLKLFTYSGFGSKTFAIFIKRVNCKRYIISQFTGLEDKNGKEIYEGDIFKRNNHCGYVIYNRKKARYEILFDDNKK